MHHRIQAHSSNYPSVRLAAMESVFADALIGNYALYTTTDCLLPSLYCISSVSIFPSDASNVGVGLQSVRGRDNLANKKWRNS